MKYFPCLALPLVFWLGCGSDGANEAPAATVPSILLSFSALQLGAEYTQVEVEVSANNQTEFSSSYDATQFAEPRTLALVGPGKGKAPGAGTLDPGLVPVSAGKLRISVTARGIQAGKGSVSRAHDVSLPTSGARVLAVKLVPECAGVSCPAGQTCEAGGACVPSLVDVDTLPVVSD